jgi:MerR family transcriptional regulator, mercuric resistance operon regulatory protein
VNNDGWESAGWFNADNRIAFDLHLQFHKRLASRAAGPLRVEARAGPCRPPTLRHPAQRQEGEHATSGPQLQFEPHEHSAPQPQGLSLATGAVALEAQWQAVDVFSDVMGFSGFSVREAVSHGNRVREIYRLHAGQPEAQDGVRTVVRSQARFSMKTSARPEMTIGALAKAAGVGVETVRYYQRRGLLPKPVRPFGGFRYYGPEALERLRSVKRAQQAGFSLADIAVLLRLDRVRDRHAAHKLAVLKTTEIDRQIQTLVNLREALSALTRACERGASDVPCPIIEAFNTAESKSDPKAGRGR